MADITCGTCPHSRTEKPTGGKYSIRCFGECPEKGYITHFIRVGNDKETFAHDAPAWCPRKN